MFRHFGYTIVSVVFRISEKEEFVHIKAEMRSITASILTNY